MISPFAEPWRLPASSSSTRTGEAPACAFESPQKKNFGNEGLKDGHKARSSVRLPNFSHMIALDESRQPVLDILFGSRAVPRSNGECHERRSPNRRNNEGTRRWQSGSQCTDWRRDHSRDN